MGSEQHEFHPHFHPLIIGEPKVHEIAEAVAPLIGTTLEAVRQSGRNKYSVIQRLELARIVGELEPRSNNGIIGREIGRSASTVSKYRRRSRYLPSLIKDQIKLAVEEYAKAH
jgi:hypothetical protein